MSMEHKKRSTAPIAAVFNWVKQKQRIRIWLHENTNMCLEGVILGTDEFMNILLDNAAEVNTKHNTNKPVGRILLKGDNITMITAAPTA